MPISIDQPVPVEQKVRALPEEAKDVPKQQPNHIIKVRDTEIKIFNTPVEL